ncbi:LADA_0E04742g1_1 [Lachancea dasiensis]|uniref:LADA_0E04742g1_1 n=1 Tax=Lachancea dasiensis TaxID=1072105 RepID=A0A1G4JBT3_9SACH|nr:LADA_0E04742g1_1 [Lachancea dasiensis]
MAKNLLGIGKKKPETKDKQAWESNVRSSSSSSFVDDRELEGTDSPKDDDSSSRLSLSIQSSSIFSKSRQTHRTGGSSTHTGDSQGRKHVASKDSESAGKPLRVLEFGKLGSLNPVVEEEDALLTSVLVDDHLPRAVRHSSRRTSGTQKERPTVTFEQFDCALEILDENLVVLMDDIHQNVTNISKAVIQAAEYFKDFLPDVLNVQLPNRVSWSKNNSLRRITKTVLHFVDTLLQPDVFNNSRAIMIKHYLSFLKKLNVSSFDDGHELRTLRYPRNFCIDAECDLPRKNKISAIMEKIAATDSACISDQSGAFIAPVLRGINRATSVLTLMFGLPQPQQEHHDLIKALYSLFPDVHFYCVKDYIQPCAEVQSPIALKPRPMESSMASQFLPPYRLPSDVTAPPISMSISSHDSNKITGTLGGYIYPHIKDDDTSLAQFAGSTFAMACAHVALAESQDYPHVAVPSTVLQKQYKDAIVDEAQRYLEGSAERNAFNEELVRIDQNLQWQEQHKFGQVVWGERAVVDQKLSDFAIIKVSPEVHCSNFLGDDVGSMANPFLRFQNLYVKDKIMKLKAGSEVFKVGATTKFTTGQVNGPKLIFWAEGRLKSSEFVVASPSPMFAAGGDSGAWILTKLTNKLGLGVVGMLHSYDGEQRQFGLYSPIGDILDRLYKVTGVKWDICKPGQQ